MILKNDVSKSMFLEEIKNKKLSCYVYCIMQELDEMHNVLNDYNKFQLTEYR
jgi:hypothetical protein